MSGRFIGSSDLPSILAFYDPANFAHLANWSNAADLYARLVLNIGKPGTDAMTRGLQREPHMREQYRRDVGWVGDPVGMVRSRKFAWAAGSPDGFAEPRVVVEFKTASQWQLVRPKRAPPDWQPPWGPSGTDLVPDKYAIQCNWLCGVTKRDVAHLLVEFGQDVDEDPEHVDFVLPKFDVTDCRIYELPFDGDLFAEYERLAERFMNEHVSAKVPPALKPVHNRRTWKVLTNGAGYGAGEGDSDDEPDQSHAGAQTVGGNGASGPSAQVGA